MIISKICVKDCDDTALCARHYFEGSDTITEIQTEGLCDAKCYINPLSETTLRLRITETIRDVMAVMKIAKGTLAIYYLVFNK